MENETYTFEDIIDMLKSRDKKQKALHERASLKRKITVTNDVFFRGIIEFSNICRNDCLYCGIRKSNSNLKRYSMTADEIMDSVDFCMKAEYGSIVLQSGELRSERFIGFLESVIIRIKKNYPKMGITLCVGEQSRIAYKRLFDAGAHRYLLRIETSSEEHYEKLHPKEMSFENRKRCLKDLKEIGYQVGSGVMIGSPFQRTEDLARDILFLKEIDVDMVGMGPYVPCKDAPLYPKGFDPKKNLDLALNMIAVLRLVMPDINIASTTALQVLSPIGRELGLQAGANVIMPIVTPTKYRESYQLYKDKPDIEESKEDSRDMVIKRIKYAGLTPKFGEWGDSLHFFKRSENGSIS